MPIRMTGGNVTTCIGTTVSVLLNEDTVSVSFRDASDNKDGDFAKRQ